MSSQLVRLFTCQRHLARGLTSMLGVVACSSDTTAAPAGDDDDDDTKSNKGDDDDDTTNSQDGRGLVVERRGQDTPGELQAGGRVHLRQGDLEGHDRGQGLRQLLEARSMRTAAPSVR